MSLAFDENGRPFIILREQEKKKRVKGLEAHKVSDITCLMSDVSLFRYRPTFDHKNCAFVATTHKHQRFRMSGCKHLRLFDDALLYTVV